MFKHRPEEIEYLQAQCKLFISICVWKLHSTNRPIFCVNLPTNGFSSLAKRFISSGKRIAASSYSVRKCTFEQTQTDTKTNSSAYFFFRCLCAFVFPACVCVVCNCLVSKLQNCFVYYPWHNNAKWVCEGKPNEQIRVHKRRCIKNSAHKMNEKSGAYKYTNTSVPRTIARELFFFPANTKRSDYFRVDLFHVE